MTDGRWKQLEGLFESAMQRDPSDRDSYLEEACGGDEELRRELKALLAGEDRTSFLKQGAATAGLRAVEMRAALQPGQRLGPYVIESHLASGGMGMVYRALDPRLDRRVAIKILRLALAGDKVRSLLSREAQSIAKLQHPNICAVFDMGEQEGRGYLVMEYLEGETLADRLKRGPLPLPQALEYATQIAAALDQAHKRNITHRDLKPGNVMITKTGAKLLDFGLAALRRPSGDFGFDRAEVGVTWTGPMGGTLPYMAPEQVRGEATDNRTDIFAYGLLLYEMVTGQRAFKQRQPEALAEEICNSPLPEMPAVPPLLQRLIGVCLAKEPDERWQNAGDLKREIAWIASSREGAARPPRWRWSAIAAILAVALAGAGWAGYRLRATPPQKPVQFAVAPPPGASFRPNLDLALSPNGEQLVFNAVAADGKSMLWIRPLDALNERVLPGTEGAYSPFWSPDSRQIAFFAGGKMKKLDPLGSAVQIICDAPTGRGGSWGRDGTILFNPKFFSEVYRVNASGGAPVRVTTLDSSLEELIHAFPLFLPDGNHFLFTALGNRHVGKVYVGSLDGKPVKRIRTSMSRALFQGGQLYFSDGGYIAGELKSQKFDSRRLELVGEPTTVSGSLDILSGLDISSTGTLAYRAAPSTARELAFVDRSGKQIAKPFGRAPLFGMNCSPDGKRIASVVAVDLSAEIVLFKLPSLEPTKLTQNAAKHWYPIWSPDGETLAYASERNGHENVFLKSMKGSDEERPLLPSQTDRVPESFSRDGRYLSITERIDGIYRIWIAPLLGSDKEFLFLKSAHMVSMGNFSPDGHWMAYWSDESGHAEIFVAHFPDGGRKQRVSTGGGSYPRWSTDGKELFFVDGRNQLLAVPVSRQGENLEFGKPVPLFRLPASRGGSSYSVLNDGKFLTMSDPAAGQMRPITIVVNASN